MCTDKQKNVKKYCEKLKRKKQVRKTCKKSNPSESGDSGGCRLSDKTVVLFQCHGVGACAEVDGHIVGALGAGAVATLEHYVVLAHACEIGHLFAAEVKFPCVVAVDLEFIADFHTLGCPCLVVGRGVS